MMFYGAKNRNRVLKQAMRFVVVILIGLMGFIPQAFAGCLPQNEIGRGIAS